MREQQLVYGRVVLVKVLLPCKFTFDARRPHNMAHSLLPLSSNENEVSALSSTL